jgi:hypothetical protein
MSTQETVDKRLFTAIKPQPTVEQVRIWARHHLVKGEAMLYAAGLTDEQGDWSPLPTHPMNHERT